MKKIDKIQIMNSYPEPQRQYHSYGVRYWNGNRWMYLGQKLFKSKGWCESWVKYEHKCYTTTGLLSAMFNAQFWSCKLGVGVQVVEFNEPKEIWSTHHTNRLLNLEDMGERQKRLRK